MNPVESYVINTLNRTRKVTSVSNKAKAYIQKYVIRQAEKVILSKPTIREYTGNLNITV